MGEKKGVRTKEEGARKGGRKDEGEGDRKSAQRAGGRRENVHSPNCFYHLPILLTQHRQTSRKKNETILSLSRRKSMDEMKTPKNKAKKQTQRWPSCHEVGSVRTLLKTGNQLSEQSLLR